MAEFTDEMESTLKKFMEEQTKKAEDLEKKVEGQENLVQRFKTEMGDARQEFKDALEKAKESGSSVDTEKVNEALDKMKKIEDNIKEAGNSHQNNQGGNGGQSVSEMKEKMTDDQKSVADEAYISLSDEERLEIASDPAKERDFLAAALEAKPSIPDSLFGDKDEKSGNGTADVNKYRKLFNLSEQEANHVPASGNTGHKSGFVSRDKKSSADSNVERRLPGGIIPRPEGS